MVGRYIRRDTKRDGGFTIFLMGSIWELPWHRCFAALSVSVMDGITVFGMATLGMLLGAGDFFPPAVDCHAADRRRRVVWVFSALIRFQPGDCFLDGGELFYCCGIYWPRQLQL
jgi:hypothetical protein